MFNLYVDLIISWKPVKLSVFQVNRLFIVIIFFEILLTNPKTTSGGRGFESHRGQRFFSFSVWAHFLSRAIAQKVLFGVFIRKLQLATFKPLCILINYPTPNKNDAEPSPIS